MKSIKKISQQLTKYDRPMIKSALQKRIVTKVMQLETKLKQTETTSEKLVAATVNSLVA